MSNPCSRFPSELGSCPGLEELLALGAPVLECCCCCPSPGRGIGLHCTQWGKLLPPAPVLAVTLLIYLHLKLAFLQLVRLILNTPSFPFLKINHNFKKLWILANKENCRGLFVAVIARAGVTITSNFKSPLDP